MGRLLRLPLAGNLGLSLTLTTASASRPSVVATKADARVRTADPGTGSPRT